MGDLSRENEYLRNKAVRARKDKIEKTIQVLTDTRADQIVQLSEVLWRQMVDNGVVEPGDREEYEKKAHERVDAYTVAIDILQNIVVAM